MEDPGNTAFVDSDAADSGHREAATLGQLRPVSTSVGNKAFRIEDDIPRLENQFRPAGTLHLLGQSSLNANQVYIISSGERLVCCNRHGFWDGARIKPAIDGIGQHRCVLAHRW